MTFLYIFILITSSTWRKNMYPSISIGYSHGSLSRKFIDHKYYLISWFSNTFLVR